MSTCNLTGSLILGLQVDDPLTESLPLLSLEVQETFISMAYTLYLNTGAHYLFLGTNGGRIFQVKICQWNVDDVHVMTNFVHVQIDLVNSTYAELVRNVCLVPDTMNKRDDVTQLVPSDDGEYVYALTAKQVSYINMNVEQLQAYKKSLPLAQKKDYSKIDTGIKLLAFVFSSDLSVAGYSH